MPFGWVWRCSEKEVEPASHGSSSFLGSHGRNLSYMIVTLINYAIKRLSMIYNTIYHVWHARSRWETTYYRAKPKCLISTSNYHSYQQERHPKHTTQHPKRLSFSWMRRCCILWLPLWQYLIHVSQHFRALDSKSEPTCNINITILVATDGIWWCLLEIWTLSFIISLCTYRNG